jgi:hypothetical protein
MRRLFKRRLYWLIAIGLAALVASFFLLIGGGDERVNKWNYYKIKEGMTEEEVEAILGPEGSKAVVLVPDASGDLPLFTNKPGHKDWTTKDCAILVIFDENKRVIRKYYFVAIDLDREESWFEDVRFSVRRIIGW